MTLTQAIKQQALRLGFQAAGIAPASALHKREGELRQWLVQGYAGGLKYMENFFDRQARYLERLPELRSFIVLTAPYSSCTKGSDPLVQQPISRQYKMVRPLGRVARYGWGQDYHDVLKKRLKPLVSWIQSQTTDSVPGTGLCPVPLVSTAVDTSPLQERALAEAAGLGFIGKNTCLIRPKAGSFFFLAILATDLDLQPDAPIRRDCGNCTLCIEACPTGALHEAYQLDAGRCISCLTIENKGEIPEALRPLLGNRLFGCDICQEVCPHNRQPMMGTGYRHGTRYPKQASWPEFAPSTGAGEALPLQEVLSIRTEEVFQTRFAGTPLLRAKREGLLGNASVVAGNSRNPALIPTLTSTAQDDPSPLIREHASWALDVIANSAQTG